MVRILNIITFAFVLSVGLVIPASDAEAIIIIPENSAEVTLQVNVNDNGWGTDDVSINSGEEVKLKWTSTDVDACTGNGFNVSATSGEDADVTEPTTGNSITYSINCSSDSVSAADDVDDVYDSITVTNVATATPTVNLEVSVNDSGWGSNDASINTGDEVSLRWTSTNAAVCYGSNFSVNSLSSEGVDVTPPTAETSITYQISCYDGSPDPVSVADDDVGVYVYDSITVTNTTLIDNIPPVAPTLSLNSDTGSDSTDNITSDSQVNVSGLEEGASWEYRIDDNQWQAGSGSSFAASEGVHTYTVRQSDAALNVSETSSITVELDTLAPVVSIVTDVNSLVVGETAVVSVYFNEIVTDFADGDLTVSVGSLENLVSTDDGDIYTAIYTPPTDTVGIASFAVSANVATDIAGNQNDASVIETTIIFGEEPVDLNPTVTLEQQVQQSDGSWSEYSSDDVVVAPYIPVRLRWQGTNVDSCNGSSFPDNLFDVSGTSGTVYVVGSVSDLLIENTYTIECVGEYGSVSSSISVTIDPTPTVTLEQKTHDEDGDAWSADHATIDHDDHIHLRWHSANTSSCHGSGFYTDGDTEGVNYSNMEPSVGSNKTYTINCTGPNGTASDSITVTKSAEPISPLPPNPVPAVTLEQQVQQLDGSWSEYSSDNVIVTLGALMLSLIHISEPTRPY